MKIKTRSSSPRARESQHPLTAKPGGAFTVIVERHDGTFTKYDNVHRLDAYVRACYAAKEVKKVYVECTKP